jgi:hypothetical protein
LSSSVLERQTRYGFQLNYADVIAVPDNPLDDITALERVRSVMKNGEVVRK